MSELLDRAKASLEGVTEGPWDHRIAPSNDSEESHAEWLAGTLCGEGRELHVVIAESPEPRYAYIVPAAVGDGPTSDRNAEFIAASRQLVPELIAEVERLEAGLAEERESHMETAAILRRTRNRQGDVDE